MSVLPMFIEALFIIAKIWKKFKCLLRDECFKCMQCIYKYYSAFPSKREIKTFSAAQVNLECIVLGEVNHTQGDKYCTFSIMWTKKKKKSNSQKQKVEFWLPGARVGSMGRYWLKCKSLHLWNELVVSILCIM